MAWSVPSNITSGQTSGISTVVNAILGDVAIIGQSAQSYTPITTGITLGNGTIAARFNQVNKWVDFSITFTFGSTSAITAVPTFTLPVTAQASGWATTDCAILDASPVADYPAMARATSTTVLAVRTWPGTAGTALVNVGAAAPITWATGDILQINGRYEAA